MSDAPLSAPHEESTSSSSLPMRLPILTEEDIAALPPVPSSSASSASQEDADKTQAKSDEDEFHLSDDGPTPIDASFCQHDFSDPIDDAEQNEEEDDAQQHANGSSSSTSSSSCENAATAQIAHDEQEVQAPVDAPLTMPDSLPPPPSTSTASQWSTDSSSTSPSSAPSPIPASQITTISMNPSTTPIAAAPAVVAAGRDSVEAAEDGADTPTVVDSGSDRTPVNEQEEEEDDVPAQADLNGASGAGEPTSLAEEDVAAAATESSSTLSESAVAESLRASEEQAAAALHRFSTSLHAKLVEQLITDAAGAVEKTLHDTVHLHGTQVRALLAQNASLDAQLQRQEERMMSMQAEWKESMVQDLQRVLHLDLHSALYKDAFASLDASPASPLAESTTSAQREEEEEREDEQEADARRSADRSSHASTNAGSSHDAAHATGHISVDELMAAYLGTRNTIQLLQRERAQWRANLSHLRTNLLAATQENATLRQRVAHLETTTVDVETHRRVAHAREEAEHQCELLRLQLAKQAEEAESLVALLERQELTQPRGAEAATAAADASAPPTTTAAAAGSDAKDKDGNADVRRGPVWDIAMRELEEQATIAANSHHLREQLAKAEADAEKLRAERDASVDYAAALKAEGDALRADAQAMVYRNGVLSQQVASLLVQVEKTNRANRILKDVNTTLRTQQQQQQQQQSAAAAAATSTSRASFSQERTLVPSNVLTSLRSSSERQSRWLAANWPSTPSSRTGPAAAAHRDSFSHPSLVSTSGLGKSLNTAMLHDQRPVADIQQLLYMPDAATDVTFMQAPTEVEEGLQQRLNTYAGSHVAVPSVLSGHGDSVHHHQQQQHHDDHQHRRSRQSSLRQLGSATLDVHLACGPRLPASDQLSGSALGRPSTYTTLDPLKGTVSRRVGSAEVSVARRGADRSEVSVVASEDDVNNDPQLLCLLDTLDKDESLDRFSVNSVSELVVRNQELVKQLYEATQRAETAERQHPQRSAKEDAAHERPPVAHTSQLPASLTFPTAALIQQQQQHRRDASSSRKRDRDDDGTIDGAAVEDPLRASIGLVHSNRPGAAASDRSSESRSDIAAHADADASAVQPWFLESASEAVTSMVDALVRRHEVRLTAVDTEVSQALLQALAAQREADRPVPSASAADYSIEGRVGSAEASGAAGAAPAAADPPTSPSSRAMAVCLRSLLQFCVRQSATLAEVALDAAQQQQELQKNVKETWTEVQATLLQALQTSQEAFAASSTSPASHSAAETLVASSMRTASPPKRARPDSISTSASTLLPSDHDGTQTALVPQRHDSFRLEEQAALLQELISLLQTAAKKDGTLLHVYQAAQARQEARQHQQKERMTRLLLKLERKRRLIKALRLHHAHGGVSGATAAVTGGVMDATRALSHAGQDTESSQNAAAAVATFRLSPQPGSPVHRTPPMPPMTLPATTLPGSPQPRLRLPHAQGSHAGLEEDEEEADATPPPVTAAEERATDHASSPQQSDADSDDDSEVDDDVLTLDIFRELQQQLALSQASHRSAQEELDAEKQKHMSMLERMWVLETSRDEAVAAKAAADEQIREMVPRTLLQETAEQLDKTSGDLAERDAQLSDARAQQTVLENKLAALKAQLEAQQSQSTRQFEQLEEVAQRREQRLLSEEGRYRELHARLSDAVQHSAALENTLALTRRAMQDKDDLVRQREATIEELKYEMLRRDDVQVLLRRLYPDNSVLHANAHLVQRLSQTTTRLQVELSEAQQDLAQTREELRQRELRVREAVQDRQAAEVRLQDALARLAELQGDELMDQSVNRASNAGGNGEGATLELDAPAATSIDALFNVEAASVTALRQRVRYLTARVEAQANDLALMRESEAAWKAREGDLRRQLELMSADPISLNARKYGLTACASFAEQLAEMQSRQDELRQALTAAEAEKARFAAQVEVAVKQEGAAEAQRAEAATQVRRMEEQLAAAESRSEAQEATIAQQKAEQETLAAQLDDSRRHYAQATSDLVGKVAALKELQASLDACRAQRDQFLKDNKQMVTAVESLEKALIQSEAEKKMAHEALAHGLSSSSSSRRHRGGGGHRGAAGERPSNFSSFTQDLSLSSLAPNNT